MFYILHVKFTEEKTCSCYLFVNKMLVLNWLKPDKIYCTYNNLKMNIKNISMHFRSSFENGNGMKLV